MKDLQGNKIEITAIQLYIYNDNVQTSEDDFEERISYSANIVLNDSFIAQVAGNEDESTFEGVCTSEQNCWGDPELQDKYVDFIDDSELEEYLESIGFENNLGFLECAPETEIM